MGRGGFCLACCAFCAWLYPCGIYVWLGSLVGDWMSGMYWIWGDLLRVLVLHEL